MTPTLYTSRLILRPLQLSDAEQIQALFPHWEIVQYLSAKVPWPYPPDGAYKFCRDLALPAMARGNEWHWVLCLKEKPEQIIGAISLMKGEKNRGFWLGLPWHGRGYMSEASEVVTGYWFDVLKFPILRIPKAEANEPSKRISVKQGMRVAERAERDYVCGRRPSEIWEMTAEEWMARKPARD